jgi:hypothetical protein
MINSAKNPSKFKSLLNIQNQQVVYLADNLPVSVKQTVINIAGRYNFRGLDDDEKKTSSRGL